ncbi:hypothetical protein CRP_103 [Candidatus Carsonella ruddii PV]|uniref:4Fe-4S ferredoxin-type domain-containing protein n=1 Tax=Carsonella ruddii (strain PV) TaxID=387662 RepID=Q05FN7_CARRP|nr:hypothetical protein [Candidatus Carsonella ruddii]BAF35134.1 hypothetical protein CRP_103 [Candidatus Carsonella ruddii PV]
MKIKNFLLYIFKKKKIKNCKKCNICTKICPLNLILIIKNNIFKNCKICNFCILNCPQKCIK